MPKTKAAGKTDLTTATLNPNFNTAVAGGQNVLVLFTFETGRSPNLGGLIDAIETLYGAGKVTFEEDTVAGGRMRLRVAA